MNLELLRALPDPSFLITTAGTIVDANGAARELLGAAARTLAGKPMRDFMGGAETSVIDFLAIAGRTRQAIPGSIRWKRQDGAFIETRCDGSLVQPAQNGDPAIVYIRCRPKQESIARFTALNEKIAALSREIQERRKIQEVLRKSEERYRTLVAATSSAVWNADNSGAFIEPQPSWETFTGQSQAEYTGWGYLKALHPEDRSRFADSWHECIETRSLFESELRVWHAASQTHHLCVIRAAGIGEGLGRAHEWMGTISDIEDRKKLEEQLRQTQKLESLGVLAGGVAHDFNNLLVGILGNSSLALETLSPNNPARQMLRDVVCASETASHLTKQLLAYAGKGRFVVEAVDLSDLIRQINSLIQASIPKNVQIRLELKDRLPCIEADLGQMQQLIMNLIINGAEAIGEGAAGTVLVTTSARDIDEEYIQTTLAPVHLEPGRYVEAEVHDTGIGMSEEVVAKIFDPFFTTKFTGRGLGLAAVLGIVGGHKGAIKVYSTPGRGTTFKVLFPALAQTAASVAINAVAASPPASGTVFVIDDEIMVRRTAKTMLERFGYTVVVAENGKEGVDLFRAHTDKVAVVILDMTMPVMSGEETLRELRALDPGVRVILSSGYNEVEAIRRFTAKGLAGFLQKPYSAKALEEKMRRVLKERPDEP